MRLLVAGALIVLALPFAIAPATAAPAAGVVQGKVLSNRADLISGGDALVEVVAPAGAKTSGLTVTAAGHDVSTAFTARPDGRLIGLVTGLPTGRSDVTAKLRDGRGATITVTNHSLS